MNVHASLLSHVNGHEYSCYALACMSLFYDLMLLYVMLMRLKFKRNPLREFMFSKPLKLMTMMTHQLSGRDPTEKSCISHSHVSVSSSKDVVGHCGDLH